jgi:3-oxoadipate enol-lactonase
MVEIATRTADGFGWHEAGPADAPALVFLHGIGGAARAFDPQLTHFAPRYRCLSWDMPGYGASKPLPAMSIATLADAARRFLTVTRATRPILVGHSIGGMITQQLLANDPQVARAVVLAQTSPAFGKSDGDWQRSFIAARLGPLDRGATMAELAPSLVAELAGDDADPAGLDLARACMAAVPEASYRGAMTALLGFDLRAALPKIAVPVLLLSGARDSNAPAAMMAKTATFIPGARYTELAGTGHLANLERPVAFNAALDDFLVSLA